MSVLDLLSEAGRLRRELFDLGVLLNGSFKLLHLKQDIAFLDVSFRVLFVNGNGLVQDFHGVLVLVHLVQRTRFVEENRHVERLVERIKVEALLVNGQSFHHLLFIALEQFGSLLFQLVSLLDVFPELLVDLRVWLTCESLSDVLLANVNLTIIDEYAAAPKQEIGLLNKLVLHLGRE